MPGNILCSWWMPTRAESWSGTAWRMASKVYEEIRGLFEHSLPASAPLFNEYHALIVHTGKAFLPQAQPDCASTARCDHFLPLARRRAR